MTGLRDGERVLRSTANAGWLPPGGTAHVIAAADRATAPDPTCLVRVLLTHRGNILAVPRDDGRGLDLPTRRVDASSPDATLSELLSEFVDDKRDARLLGYVMNIVEAPSDAYAWPAPYAHFAVWQAETEDLLHTRGTWLDASDARTHLRQRHWWPLHRLVGDPSSPQVHRPSGPTERLDQVLDEEVPRYAEALERLGQ